ncbi:MAG: hypothetical protein H7263_17200 [Candidatus Sericytochromatia bacterium]|nr:hypothetical protein [Candidatus Sericytochromatia bacterium]
MNVLFVSNGEAEDAIALSLIRYWLYFREEDRVAALAIAGTGKQYLANDIPLISQPMQMPSNGFAYQNWRLLYQDFEAGLFSHIRRQYKSLKKLSNQIDYIVGVGDIVPVIASRILKKPSSFVGCAMSDYYINPQKSTTSSYSGLKRSFLKNMNTLVFPRDLLTTNNLIRLGVRAEYLGNPMLDCIQYNKNLDLKLNPENHIIAILPGSHDDARNNFRIIMSLVEKMKFDKPLIFLVAVADKEDIPRYGKDLSKSNWFIQKSSPRHTVWKNNKDQLHLLSGYFGNILMTSHAVIGTSGTGNEQAAGIGIPVISFPCGSIQYTKRFGEAQKRLLGKSLSYINNSSPSSDLLLKHLNIALTNTQYREQVKNNAIERFGDFGASERIVSRIVQTLSPQIN